MPALCSCSARHSLKRHVRLDALQRVLETGARDDHVADQPHQIVEPRQIDAHEVGGRHEWHIVWTLDRMVRRSAGDQTGLG